MTEEELWQVPPHQATVVCCAECGQIREEADFGLCNDCIKLPIASVHAGRYFTEQAQATEVGNYYN